MTGTLFFTYGSLMFSNIFEGVTGEKDRHQKATLKQWSRNAMLDKTKPEAAPSLNPQAQVDGILWLEASDIALKNLNIFEASDCSREIATVVLENGSPRKAWVYHWIEESLLFGKWDAAVFAKQHQADFVAHHWQTSKDQTSRNCD